METVQPSRTVGRIHLLSRRRENQQRQHPQWVKFPERGAEEFPSGRTGAGHQKLNLMPSRNNGSPKSCPLMLTAAIGSKPFRFAT